MIRLMEVLLDGRVVWHSTQLFIPFTRIARNGSVDSGVVDYGPPEGLRQPAGSGRAPADLLRPEILVRPAAVSWTSSWWWNMIFLVEWWRGNRRS
jgi:hypothetical protein